jgi:hypothetical protein
MRNPAMAEQLSSALNLTEVRTINPKTGLDSTITLSTTGLRPDSLMRDREEVSCQLQKLNEDLHKLIRLGERTTYREEWGIDVEGTIVRDGLPSKDAARDALREVARKMVKTMDLDSLTDPAKVEQIIFKCGDVKRLRTFPVSRSVKSVWRRIYAHQTQIEQLDQLIEQLS